MPKRATAIQLSEQEQEELTRLTKRRRGEQQEVLRACIILAAAPGASNAQIARFVDESSRNLAQYSGAQTAQTR